MDNDEGKPMDVPATGYIPGIGHYSEALVAKYGNMTFWEICKMFEKIKLNQKPIKMDYQDQNKAQAQAHLAESPRTKSEEILETLAYLKDSSTALKSEITALAQRVGVIFDPPSEKPTGDPPPSYGSLAQMHDDIGKIGTLVSDCINVMADLSRFL